MKAKTITDRNNSARAVVHAATIHGQAAAAGLQSFLFDGVPDGEPAPDVGQVIRLVAAQIERQAQRLVAANNLHQSVVVRDIDPRERRDEAVAALRKTLSGIRQAVEGAFGPRRGAVLFRLEGATPVEPGALLVQAQQVLEQLADPAGLAMPESRVVAGVSVDVAAVRAQLEGPTAALAEALDTVGAVQREAEATLKAKNAAIAAHDATFLRGARLLEALFTAAGMPDLAARVRPSRRRPGRTEVEPPEPTGPEGEPEPAPADPGPAVPGPTVN